MKKTHIVITGPTAVGKTALAIQVAQHFSTAIISADSRQCFKELNIGVAKPSAEELNLVPHHFISSHHITDTVNAAVFEQYALEKTADIFQANDVAVMVGGTGLYIKAFCEGIDQIPVIEPGIREAIMQGYATNGLGWLQGAIKKSDPAWFATGETMNPQRVMRALEIKLSTGRSILDFQTAQKRQRDFNIITIGLELPRETLYTQINRRVDSMMEAGLLSEVEALQPFRELNALQTVGYKEIFSYFDKEISLQQAIEAIKQNTRHYAKRQMTWFKKNANTLWSPPNLDQVQQLIFSAMKNAGNAGT